MHTQNELHFPEPALKSIVNRYRWAAKYSAGLDLDDLAQVAREAVERSKPLYDPTRGGKSFFGFAWMRASQAVHLHANEHRAAVRVPCRSAHGRTGPRVVYTNSITVTEHAQQHGCGDAEDTLLDVWLGGAAPTVESDLDAQRTAERVRAAVDAVTRSHPTRGRILAGVYLDGRTGLAMADELGVTHQSVAQHLKRALVDFRRAWLAAGWGAP